MINEHRADKWHHIAYSALVDHIDKTGHVPAWNEAKVPNFGLDKGKRKVLEAMYITTNKIINKRRGDIVWATPPAAVCMPWARGR